MKSFNTDANYWKDKSVIERLQALELLRQQYAASSDSPQKLQRVYRILNKNDVQYLVVGGYALAVYGHSRFSGS